MDTSRKDTENYRERLRTAFLLFRERAAYVAGEINRDLPEFTVHDVTHLDALWEMADLIAGPDFYLTPTEAFVLGGSFLIHDLGNGLAAYPDGLAKLQATPLWIDTLTALLKKRLGRHPTIDELSHPDKELQNQAVGELLRTLHARHAEELALVSWKDRKSDEEYFLLQDSDLRRMYGALIGRIAHSHWWPVDQLVEEFVTLLGAPAGFPREWTVDPLKVACLLRTADASHLDTRRAPSFLRALRKPSDYSRAHWIFQERLQQPQLAMDRLVYTSAHAFSLDEADSWWLCFDTLKMVDRELQQVDALLADTNHLRLAARGVAGADDPRRLVKWIPTNQWIPIDTTIRVSNVASLVRTLGGEQLYGQNKWVPLRELIQNSSDAIRARRLLETRSSIYGDVRVRTGKDDGGYWIELEDNGVGMSREVLTGPFLDFGSSFWGSTSMLSEFPGLLAKGFESTGKYGVGFFSAFMWGDRVRVTTRAYKDAQRETQVLEFYGGVGARPILRRAAESEYMRDGGTVVRIWMKNPFSFGGIFDPINDADPQNWNDLCAWLCPSIDINLIVETEPKESVLVISSSDWKDHNGIEFLNRILGLRKETNKSGRRRKANTEGSDKIQFSHLLSRLANNLRLLEDASGAIIGRACIVPPFYKDDFELSVKGVVTVGGFRSTPLSGICGVLVGTSENAARDLAVPVVDSAVLAKWASEQSDLVMNVFDNSEKLLDCAEIIRCCGGDTGDLPIARGRYGPVSAKEIASWDKIPNEILLIQDAALSNTQRRLRDVSVTLYEHVLAVSMGVPGVLQTGIFHRLHVDWPPTRNSPLGFHSRSLEGAVIEALAAAWGSKIEDVVACSSLQDDETTYECEIGMAGNQPLEMWVNIIRKPN